LKGFEVKVQKITDRHVDRAHELQAKKDAELMEI
ncbi:MAG: ribosome recycling factor, partial [Candidatus Hydrogenedentes bacterium]|nr:ribosome recycling factor [Candidatus Hydrogenedentota bacterium]